MLIFDFNQLTLASVIGFCTSQKVREVDLRLMRHIVLNMLRSNILKFNDKDVVLACDSRNSWRKEVFPYYKASRAEAREQIGIDFNKFFENFATIKTELKEFFPYVLLEIDRAEADDIISVIIEINQDKQTTLISSDKDFVQLQLYKNPTERFETLKQYDPIHKKYNFVENVEKHTVELIVRGDRTDGVPNILSPNESFIQHIRQKPITQKYLDNFDYEKALEDNKDNPEFARRLQRNMRLIMLYKNQWLPPEIKTNIIEEYNKQNVKEILAFKRQNMLKYFISNDLVNLLGEIGDF